MDGDGRKLSENLGPAVQRPGSPYGSIPNGSLELDGEQVAQSHNAFLAAQRFI